MAGVIHQIMRQRLHRRGRLYRDRVDPLDKYDDLELYQRFRFGRADINNIVAFLREDLEFGYNRKGSLSPELQVLIALRFYATGTFQNMIGDTVNVDKSTISRTIHRVTRALCARAREQIRLPSTEQANRQKRAFATMGRPPGLPNVLGCVDGTQIQIQGPTQNEHTYTRAHTHTHTHTHTFLFNCLI